MKLGLFGKRDFKINVRDQTITCPAGQVEPFEPGQQVHFDPEACGACSLREKCTQAASGKGRSVSMGEDEALQKKLRRLQTTRKGREKLRTRVPVEHQLAHIANRQGPTPGIGARAATPSTSAGLVRSRTWSRSRGRSRPRKLFGALARAPP